MIESRCEVSCVKDNESYNGYNQTYEWIANEICNKLNYKFIELSPITTSKVVVKVAPQLYKLFPENNDAFIKVCNILIQSKEWMLFQLVTTIIKMRTTAYKIEYFPIYQNWLYEYTDSWGACDILCYRVLNPMIERYPLLFDIISSWAKDEKVYVRRASAVCLIKSTAMSFDVEVPFEYVKNICDILKFDKHLHIQKGIGWLLKYAYIRYSSEVEDYLHNNIKNLSRTTFRYALEKMSREKRDLFMQL